MMVRLITAHPAMTIISGSIMLLMSSMWINTLAIPVLFSTQLIGFVLLWLGIAQGFARHPFPFNRVGAQHMDWMALIQYVGVCIAGGLMLWFDPQRFDWVTNGSRFYLTVTTANIAYYVVHMMATPHYINKPLVFDKIFHHIAFVALFSLALLLGHWEYLFIWVGFLSLLYAIPFKVFLLLKASKHRWTDIGYFVQYITWMILRVGVFGGLMIFYFFILDKSQLPISFYWSLFVPFTFFLQAALTLYWTVDMTRIAHKLWQRRAAKHATPLQYEI